MHESFLSETELLKLNFKRVGNNVRVSRFARIYGAHWLTIADNVRIDDYVILSIDAESSLGNCVHISNSVSILSPLGFEIGDYAGVSPGARIFGANDDFKNGNLMHPTVPIEYRSLECSRVVLGKYSQVGTNSILLPFARLGVGSIVGALSMVKHEIEDWSIYAGIPAIKVGLRKKITRTPEELL